MKRLLTQGALFAVIAVLVTAATGILALIAVGALLTLIGNLAFWPFVVTLLFGAPVSPEVAFALGALMLAIIVAGMRYFPGPTEGVLATVATIYLGGFFYSMLLGVLGLPAFFILKYVFDLDLPVWAILPIGLASMFAILFVANQCSRKRKLSPIPR